MSEEKTTYNISYNQHFISLPRGRTPKMLIQVSGKVAYGLACRLPIARRAAIKMECGFNLDARGQFPRALLSCSTNYKPKIGQECPTALIRRLATLAGSAMRSIKQ